MDRQLLAEQEKIFQRLTEKWILTRGTVAEEVDGCNIIISTLLDILNAMLGEIASQAIIRRACALARHKYPLLATAVITQSCLNTDRLKAELQGKSPEEVQEALAGLVGELFTLLNTLLSGSVMPILRDLDSQLAAKEIEPPAGKEGP